MSLDFITDIRNDALYGKDFFYGNGNYYNVQTCPVSNTETKIASKGASFDRAISSEFLRNFPIVQLTIVSDCPEISSVFTRVFKFA